MTGPSARASHDPLPLASLAGAVPPGPGWFVDAIAQAPERTWFVADGTEIELLVWGERGRPGVLLLHGDGAHADWWSFIAPFLATDRRVAAISWSGMGRSGWRDTYSFAAFAGEILGAIDAAGLAEGERPPDVVAHSFGGYPAMVAAAQPGRFGHLVCVDSAILPRRMIEAHGPRIGPLRVYPSEAAALARFRLAPPQPSEHLFILDHIARRSLRTVGSDEADGPGWTWCFDPWMWRGFDHSANWRFPAAVRCPFTLLYGERSGLVVPHLDYMRELLPPRARVVAVPDADHHVLLDQPLALVAAIRALLA